ncbi:hypothetical protein COS81_04335 [candidate division WWE3 bacterium CG06_land_8_20_14_3_00_42_16]|uniref:Uncharacterized protein n=4 Tax=Katanobacteria TaxID=422282 RepID=A0A2M7ALV7_UNCKA|nr:MAG: hypothetical protein AUJ38_04055 [bacterium CG1_02_42_9]PIU68334.1 MAG: hypothetical protein COS81_04335 [candidate division WWE3 bacterium CG06_land_8_20_14_3_00_42_16]PIZ41985.1 MAG: hypothetical protein COY34_03655 [candidate division WWE3 bacterium CG_4_10_14_0_2_um_filter_42_8]PJA37347.1 MAG: hypothetical protein CO181_03890 [candidate division WWE3 bacterium CG_4_9_14_3_um_filter_43_9]PJC69454.1 MAG: hypothetical protein CO015_00160 [candidate division WWE3 bacterium CG_4_8_14_3_u
MKKRKGDIKMEMQRPPEGNQSLEGLVEGERANLKYTLEGDQVRQLVLKHPHMIEELDLRSLLPEGWNYMNGQAEIDGFTPPERVKELLEPDFDAKKRSVIVSDFEKIPDPESRRIVPEEVLWYVLTARALADSGTKVEDSDAPMQQKICAMVKQRRDEILEALGDVRRSAKEVAERPFNFE